MGSEYALAKRPEPAMCAGSGFVIDRPALRAFVTNAPPLEPAAISPLRFRAEPRASPGEVQQRLVQGSSSTSGRADALANTRCGACAASLLARSGDDRRS